MKQKILCIFSMLGMFLTGALLHSWEGYECCEYNCAAPDCNGTYAKDGFYAAGIGMWARPSETGLGTFTDSWQYLDPDDGITALSKPSKAKCKGAWGGRVGYDSCSGYNIEASYFHLHNSKHNFNDTSDGPISFGSAFFNLGIPLTPGEDFVSDSHLKFTLDQVDVKFGRAFDFCNGDLRLLPTIGVRFIELKHDLTFLVGHVRSKYWGAGPMLGFDGAYRVWNGFFITGRFDGAISMGRVKSNSLLTFAAINRYKSPSTDRIVYAVDGSLGLAYRYTFCNQSYASIEAGYRVASYIGPFDIIQAFVEPIPRIGTLETTNFGYSGPFIELMFHM